MQSLLKAVEMNVKGSKTRTCRRVRGQHTKSNQRYQRDSGGHHLHLSCSELWPRLLSEELWLQTAHRETLNT